QPGLHGRGGGAGAVRHRRARPGQPGLRAAAGGGGRRRGAGQAGRGPGGGGRGDGLLLAAVAVGGVPGSLLAARVGERVPPGALIVGGVFTGAVVMACFGLATNPWLAGVAYAATGAVWGVWNVTLLSLRQAIVSHPPSG